MTKKHYQILANLIRKAVLVTVTEEDKDREVILKFLNSFLIPNLVDGLQADNPRFDASKFIDAIGLRK